MSGAAAQRDALEKVVTSLLSDGTHTEEELMGLIAKFRPVVAADLTDHEIEVVARGLTQRLLIDVDLGVALTSETSSLGCPASNRPSRGTGG